MKTDTMTFFVEIKVQGTHVQLFAIQFTLSRFTRTLGYTSISSKNITRNFH